MPLAEDAIAVAIGAKLLWMQIGDPRHGFARICCDACRHAFLLAYACKARWFCPSCQQKRVLLYGE